MSFYDLLGVSDAATPEDIKKAYLVKARQCHPDVNPGVDEKAFKQVSQAYETLRDVSRRAQYDAARSVGRRDGVGQAYNQPGSSSPGADPFEEAFARWWQKAGANWRTEADADAERSREEARRHMAAAAWEAEKAEAPINKARAERVRLRTEQARQARHLKTLRTVWQTHAGMTWQDLVFVAAMTGTLMVAAHAWKPLPHTSDAGPDTQP